jgi:hypothetical protein
MQVLVPSRLETSGSVIITSVNRVKRADSWMAFKISPAAMGMPPPQNRYFPTG